MLDAAEMELGQANGIPSLRHLLSVVESRHSHGLLAFNPARRLARLRLARSHEIGGHAGRFCEKSARWCEMM